MSVEQAIHERWAGYSPLTRLVPEDRVSTGPVKSGSMPYVTMERTGDSNNTRTSESNFESVMLRIDIIDDDLENAKRIAREVQHAFERADFSYSLGKVLDMKKTNRTEAQDEKNAWHIMLDWKIEAWQPAGA